MKNIVVISILCAAVALVACRREVRHAPLKLGADVQATQPAAR
jgi:hypothetical protein